MESMVSSETSVCFCRTRRGYIQEGNILIRKILLQSESKLQSFHVKIIDIHSNHLPWRVIFLEEQRKNSKDSECLGRLSDFQKTVQIRYRLQSPFSLIGPYFVLERLEIMYKALANFPFYGNDLLSNSLQKLGKAEPKYGCSTATWRTETQSEGVW